MRKIKSSYSYGRTGKHGIRRRSKSNTSGAFGKPRFDKWKVGDRLWVRETYTRIHGRAVYAATCDIESYRWRPSIFMPRRFSRILLEITELKRELLRDVSEADALREGFENNREFLDYFEKINPEIKWENPVVMAIGFKVLEAKK